MKCAGNQRWPIQMMGLILTGIVSLMPVSAKEHSWISPGQCTPHELIHMVIDRQMPGTSAPVLLPQEKLVIELEEARLVLEVVAIEANATRVGWLWIGSKKVLSGSVVIENSQFVGPMTKDTDKPFDFEQAGGGELKGVHVACSSDVRNQRVTISTGGKRYALITRDDPGEHAVPSGGDTPSN